MSRRNNKKHNETTLAKQFVLLVLNQLEDRHGKSSEVREIAQKCIREMPKFDSKPELRRRYQNILNRLANGSFSAELVAQCFRLEKKRLQSEIAAF